MNAEEKARELGAEHGKAAGEAWLETFGECGHFQRQGTPCADHALPEPDLSGEWVDGYSPRQLVVDATGGYPKVLDMTSTTGLMFQEIENELCDAYAAAFTAAVEATVRAKCEETT